MTTDRAYKSRKRGGFSKHAWEKKARHTLTQDPVGSQVDRVSQCSGSFLSCWSTCDLAHSAHSVPGTHQYLQQHKRKNISKLGQKKTSFRAGIGYLPGILRVKLSPPQEWTWLVAAPKLFHPQVGILIQLCAVSQTDCSEVKFFKKSCEKTLKNKEAIQ